MWQVMWLVGLLPDWVFHLILIIGVLALVSGKFLQAVPFVSQYSIPIKVVGSVLTVIGIWFNGSIASDAKWEAKVAELEAKVAAAEKASAEANAKIETVYVDRVKVVKEIQYRNINTIKNSASELDANCTIPPKAIDILNNSAVSGKPSK